MKAISKLLVGYDGSEGAQAALDDLTRAGLPEEAEALVLAVADLMLPPPSSFEVVEAAFEGGAPPGADAAAGPVPPALEEHRRTAERGAEWVRQVFPRWSVRAQAIADSPAWGIIRVSEHWQPDLIVVGTHGRSALGRFFIGSTSLRLLNESRTAVRIARPRAADPGAPVRVVVGYDGSRDAEAAVETVAGRSFPSGTEVRVVGVLDDSPDDPAVEAEAKRSLGDALEAAAGALRARGLAATAELETGDPKHVLLESAERFGADCIFVGARGLRRVERFLLGSVSTAVAARAHCSVEVVRPPRP